MAYYYKEIPGNDSQDPPPPTAIDEALAYRCEDVGHLTMPRSVAAIEQRIRDGQIVGIAIPVYRSWFRSAVVRKYGNITVPLPGEVPDPIGHAVELVGYENNGDFAGGGYFIVRNSWGKLWATSSAIGPGYGTIPYRYIERFNWDAWCVRS